MSDRLFVGVLGHRRAGKSTTWNRLFGRTVKTGNRSRMLKLRPGECVEVFLVSGSPQERRKYTRSILRNQQARIVLCSMQYVEEAADTIRHVIDKDFLMHIQWLNPGYSDPDYRSRLVGRRVD
jgi:hypothetical protein